MGKKTDKIYMNDFLQQNDDSLLIKREFKVIEQEYGSFMKALFK